MLDAVAVAGDRLVTSEWVLMEFLNATSSVRRRRLAIGAVRRLMSSADVEVVEATHAGFESAVVFYEARPDKEWSLVDCASFVICQQRTIERVFTADQHFRQAGFEILL
jgi:predicted nucleic acid-binding protein